MAILELFYLWLGRLMVCKLPLAMTIRKCMYGMPTQAKFFLSTVLAGVPGYGLLYGRQMVNALLQRLLREVCIYRMPIQLTGIPRIMDILPGCIRSGGRLME